MKEKIESADQVWHNTEQTKDAREDNGRKMTQMSIIRVAIVEDEENQYKRLKHYLTAYASERELPLDVQHFTDAVNFVSDYHYQFDLIFMDIMLPLLNGMTAAERLRQMDQRVALIFVTNMERYAVQGYDVGARYFMVKPVQYSDLKVKLDRTIASIRDLSSQPFLILSLPNEKRKVYVRDIRYVEVFTHDVVFHLPEGEVHVRGTLKEYEKKLEGMHFCRINSCYLVNLDHVTALKDMSLWVGDQELRISIAKKKNLMQAFADKIAADSL